MGALTALEAAARAGDRVTHLALLGVAYPMAVADGFLKLAEQNDPSAYDMMIDWAFARGAHIGHAPVPGLWMIGDALSTVRAARPGTLHAGLKACSDYEGGLEAASRVKAPVRLILGREDMMTPVRAAVRLAEAFHHADTVVLEDCGHMMMLEKDAAVRRALKDFLAA
jgi:pimeloyl-ACP methyl ester carboxylesterase